MSMALPHPDSEHNRILSQGMVDRIKRKLREFGVDVGENYDWNGVEKRIEETIKNIRNEWINEWKGGIVINIKIEDIIKGWYLKFAIVPTKWCFDDGKVIVKRLRIFEQSLKENDI